MWYFSWILGTGLACSFAILNALWVEVRPAAAKDQSTKVHQKQVAKTSRSTRKKS